MTISGSSTSKLGWEVDLDKGECDLPWEKGGKVLKEVVKIVGNNDMFLWEKLCKGTRLIGNVM